MMTVPLKVNLKDQVALVTGATRGIGAAIAKALGAAGATVVGTATSDTGAQAITGQRTLHGTGGGPAVDNPPKREVAPLMARQKDVARRKKIPRERQP